MCKRLPTSPFLFALTAITPLASALAQPSPRSNLSAEGQAIFEEFYRNPDPDLAKCLDDRKRIERWLIEEGDKPAFDWPAAAKALLNKQTEIQQSCAKSAQRQFVKLMERLPASDRAIYFRSLHRSLSAPIISSKP